MQFGMPAPKPRTNLAQGAAKLAFLTGIAATVLLAWQGITLHVQQFSVRPDAVAPMATTVARWVHNWTAVLKPAPTVLPPGASAYEAESRMSAGDLINRWTPVITEASERFDIPARWIRAVVQMESAGRTMSSASRPITSKAGAMGVMQLMPGTYGEMRVQYHLGANPYNPHDNIFAGAAYLSWLYKKYGYPTMFAAYNDGPGHLGERLVRGGLLPAETRNYVSHIVSELGGTVAHVAGAGSTAAVFTRPNGKSVKIELAQITSVRRPLPGEYSSDVQAVIATGDVRQAVRESFDAVKKAMAAGGALGVPIAVASGEAHSTRHAHLAGLSHRTRHRAAHNAFADGGERTADANPIRLHRISARRQS